MNNPFLPKYPLPVDLKESYAQMLRVNLAGEEGAVAIYKGQLSKTHQEHEKKEIEEMLSHETEHCKLFQREMRIHQSRPSLFSLLWNPLGYGVGRLSMSFGYHYAMAQTEAIEEVIVEHYQTQIDQTDLQSTWGKLLKQCQEDEAHHQHIGKENSDTSLTLDLWRVLTRLGTRTCIALAKRI